MQTISNTLIIIEPVLNKGKEFVGKTVTPQVLEYPMSNATNIFLLKKVFERQRNKENPVASTFANNTLFVTKFPLPGILRWAEVSTEIKDLETTPIQNCLSMLQEKNLDLELTLKKINHDPKSVNMNQFGQTIQGTVVPTVGGGIPKIEEAFLTDEYKEGHPEDNELITQLIEEIKRQVKLCEALLDQHDKYKDPVFQPMQNVMEEELEKTKTSVARNYGGDWKNVGEGFRVSFKDPIKHYLQ